MFCTRLNFFFTLQKHSKTGKDIKVLFRYKRQIKPGERESLYIYNLIFKKIMKILKFVESAKKANFFDPKAGKEIKVSMCLLKLFVTRLLQPWKKDTHPYNISSM